MRDCYKIKPAVSEEPENALTRALAGYNRARSPLWEQNQDAPLSCRKNPHLKGTA